MTHTPMHSAPHLSLALALDVPQLTLLRFPDVPEVGGFLFEVCLLVFLPKQNNTHRYCSGWAKSTPGSLV